MAEDDEGLSQPLLARGQAGEGTHDADDGGDAKGHSAHGHSQQQIIAYPGPFDLRRFLTYVLLCWRRVVDMLRACVGACMPQVAAHKMSLLQLDALEALEARCAVPYDSSDPEHQAMLRQLWSHAFPGEPPSDSLKSPRWKDMGWQGEDPSTDIRGSGLFGLECLLYLAEAHPATWTRLQRKLDGTRSEWEYPFAAAGLNVQFMLSELVGLSTHRAAPGGARSAGAAPELPSAHPAATTAQGRGFLGLLSSDASAFEELFVASFEALDAEWLAQRASYMQFNQVLKAVKERVRAALAAGPSNVAQLRAKLA